MQISNEVQIVLFRDAFSMCNLMMTGTVCIMANNRETLSEANHAGTKYKKYMVGRNND